MIKAITKGATPGVWTTDLAAAKKVAADLGTYHIMLVALNSCSFCNTALRRVFDTDAFKAWAERAGVPLVLVDASRPTSAFATGILKKYPNMSSVPIVMVMRGDVAVKRFVFRNGLACKPYGTIDLSVPNAVKIIEGYACGGACEIAPEKPATPTKTCPTCKGSGKVAVALACILALASGCAMLYNKTPILGASADGTPVVANATTIKFGFGTKDATAVGTLRLSAESGLFLEGYDSKTDSSMALIKAIELGAQLGGAYMRAQGVPVQPITLSPTDTTVEAVAP